MRRILSRVRAAVSDYEMIKEGDKIAVGVSGGKDSLMLLSNIQEIQAQLTAAVQAYMDSTAQTRGYDNIHTACSYSNSTDPIFAAEGQACLQWRDMVWRKCYNILAEVQAGSRDIPTVEELIAELPVLVW